MAAKITALAAGMAATIISVDVGAYVETLQGEQRKLQLVGDQIIARVQTEQRDFTDSEKKELRDTQAKMESHAETIKLYQRQLELRANAERPGSSATLEDRDVNPRGGKATVAAAGGSPEKEARDREYARVFDRWLRRGHDGMTAEQREVLQSGRRDTEEVRDMSAGTGSAGGYVIPQGFVAELQTALKAYGALRGAPTKKFPTDSGNDMPIPTINDTGNVGELLAENTAAAVLDATLGQVTLKAYLYSSKEIPVSNVLLQDSGIDLSPVLTKIMAERIGRITNTHFTTGTGAGQPQGIITGAAAGVTAASATAITYDELIKLQHTVDPAYRSLPTSGWMFNDATFELLRKLKDSDGRPIWQQKDVSGMDGGPPGNLLGSPYFINQDMAGPATGNKSILFGDFSNFWIRDVKEIVIVRAAERRVEKYQTSFFAFMRTDSRVVNAGTNPLKYLTQA